MPYCCVDVKDGMVRFVWWLWIGGQSRGVMLADKKKIRMGTLPGCGTAL